MIERVESAVMRTGIRIVDFSKTNWEQYKAYVAVCGYIRGRLVEERRTSEVLDLERAEHTGYQMGRTDAKQNAKLKRSGGRVEPVNVKAKAEALFTSIQELLEVEGGAQAMADASSAYAQKAVDAAMAAARGKTLKQAAADFTGTVKRKPRNYIKARSRPAIAKAAKKRAKR